MLDLASSAARIVRADRLDSFRGGVQTGKDFGMVELSVCEICPDPGFLSGKQVIQEQGLLIDMDDASSEVINPRAFDINHSGRHLHEAP